MSTSFRRGTPRIFRRALSYAMALALLPVGALAEPWGCEFTVSCVAGAACDALDPSIGIEVLPADHQGELFMVFALVTPVPVERLTPEDEPIARYTTGAEILTVAPDGRAAYSKHIVAGTLEAQTLLGTCERL